MIIIIMIINILIIIISIRSKLVDFVDMNSSSKKEKVFVDRYFDVSPLKGLMFQTTWQWL
jgi:hypothetical protein